MIRSGARCGHGCRLAPRELHDQSRGQSRREHRATLGHGQHCRREFLGIGVFEQEPGGAAVECLEYVLVEIERGDHDDAGCRKLGKNFPGRSQSVAVRHADVHQHDIRTQCTHLLVRLDSRLGVPDDANFGVTGEKQFETLPYHLLVVRNKDIDHALILPFTGTSACTAHSPSEFGPASS